MAYHRASAVLERCTALTKSCTGPCTGPCLGKRWILVHIVTRKVTLLAYKLMLGHYRGSFKATLSGSLKEHQAAFAFLMTSSATLFGHPE